MGRLGIRRAQTPLLPLLYFFVTYIAINILSLLIGHLQLHVRAVPNCFSAKGALGVIAKPPP